MISSKPFAFIEEVKIREKAMVPLKLVALFYSYRKIVGLSYCLKDHVNDHRVSSKFYLFYFLIMSSQIRHVILALRIVLRGDVFLSDNRNFIENRKNSILYLLEEMYFFTQ